MGKIRAFLDLFRSSPKPEPIGLNDIDGKPIHEGDEVLIFVQEYKSEKISGDEFDGTPLVYVVDTDKPLPVSDIPMARGIVAWNPSVLAYEVQYSWKCPQWSDGASSARMGGYAYQVITCNHGD